MGSVFRGEGASLVMNFSSVRTGFEECYLKCRFVLRAVKGSAIMGLENVLN